MIDSGDNSECLQDLGEEEVVRRLVSGLSTSDSVLVGPGDDCAVVDAGGEDLLLLKTDAVIEGGHFLSGTAAERVGWKAAARVISDFGAMGGEARELLITLAAPGECQMDWVERLYKGLGRCADQFGAGVVGGETVSLPTGSPIVINAAGTGRVRRGSYVTRAGGKVGDALYVTGRLGGSFESGHHLDFMPRVREGQWLARWASAMMDLSDGLQRALPRLARATDCGFDIELGEHPCREGCGVQQALCDGEDMELLVAARGRAWEADFRLAFPEIGLTRIGTLVAEGQTDLGEGGWQHFREED